MDNVDAYGGRKSEKGNKILRDIRIDIIVKRGKLKRKEKEKLKI